MKSEKLVTGLIFLLVIAVGYRLWKGDPPSDFSSHPDEYLLSDEIPENVRSRLHPWVEGFVGLSVEDATKRLKQRWESIERPSLKELSKTLGEFEVRGIVDCENGGMIYAYRPGSPDEGIGDFFYLPAPMDPNEIRDLLKLSKLDTNECLAEFLYHFGGLSESNEAAGSFVYRGEPWYLFTDSWDGAIEGFDAWENSLMLYHALNGCFVLVRPDGKVAWWMMQEHYVREEAKDFDEFVGIFNEHRKLSWPFDPYGVPDSQR